MKLAELFGQNNAGVFLSCQVLGEAGAHITSHAKKGDIDEFGRAVEETSMASLIP